MKIGIIGAGMIGSTVGKLWVDAGHEVFLASRHPKELESLVAKLGKRASAGTPAAYEKRDGVVAGEASRHPQGSAGWAALDVAAQLARDAGFDPVVVGLLARGKEFEPGTKPYNSGMSGRLVRKVLEVP